LSFAARLLYIALWCEADREGRLTWRPATFKLRYFPGDKVNIDALARELIARGLVVEYSENLAYIPTFAEHQHVNPREAPSSLPVPTRVTTRESTRDDASNPDMHVQGGREGRERKGRSDVALGRDAALQILKFLNDKTGRDYQPVDANLDMIAARLKEGATVEDCRAVVAKKCREWSADEKMSEYLRPATLFNATKFAQYRGEISPRGEQ
jgi:uncharacterized phage protein (TIGR02220 family)